MQTADLIFISISGLMVDVLYYRNRLSVKIASENYSEDEIETLHGPVRQLTTGRIADGHNRRLLKTSRGSKAYPSLLSLPFISSLFSPPLLSPHFPSFCLFPPLPCHGWAVRGALETPVICCILSVAV